MRKIIFILTLLMAYINSYSQTEQITFTHDYYDLNAEPRTQINSMSIKLFDDYSSYRPSPATAPGNNSYGTMFVLYGRNNHWEHNLYFGANKKIYYRMAVYPTWSAEDGTLGGFNYWRTILDSRSDVESNGLLKLTGNGNHYISNGNVGIGTTTPYYKLDVEGTIRAHEIKVNLNSGADFVFEEDYNLMPLNELETFVKTKKHLPEVAPAKEMETEGLSISEMNIKLLQKIEELTLYVIELKKENEKQSENLDCQGKRINELEEIIKKLQ